MSPVGSSGRRIMNPSTQASVANSTVSSKRHGSFLRLTSVVKSALAVMYEAREGVATRGVDGRRQRVEHECYVDALTPGRHVREVRDPALIWPCRHELPIDSTPNRSRWASMYDTIAATASGGRVPPERNTAKYADAVW